MTLLCLFSFLDHFLSGPSSQFCMHQLAFCWCTVPTKCTSGKLVQLVQNQNGKQMKMMSFAPTCTNIGAFLVLNKTEPEMIMSFQEKIRVLMDTCDRLSV